MNRIDYKEVTILVLIAVIVKDDFNSGVWWITYVWIAAGVGRFALILIRFFIAKNNSNE